MAEALLVDQHLGPVLSVLVGLALLLVGRKLFWVFVGAVGFLLGMQWGATVLAGQPQWMILALAIVLGLVGAILAIFLQRIAVAFAAGLAGGSLAVVMVKAAGMGDPNVQMIAFVIGAILAAILMIVIFDWALIILSSLYGGALIAQTVLPENSLAILATIVLCVVGIVVQSRSLAGRT